MPFVRMNWLNSLGVKVLLAYVGGALLSVALIVATAGAIVKSQGDVVSGFDVADSAKDLADEMRFNDQGVPVGVGDGRYDSHASFNLEDDFNLEWIFDSLRQEVAYRVLDASGHLVLSSAAGPAFWPASGDASRLTQGRFEFEHDGVPMRGATVLVEKEGRVWYFQLAVSRRFLHLIYQAFALPFTGAGITLFSLVLLLVFGPSVYFTLQHALRPVKRTSEAASEISPRSIHARLKTDGVPREVAPLVASFNRALERLEQGYRSQQEFLAMAAHELKTPLALVRAQIELGTATVERSVVLRDVEHMGRLVQQLLLLAEASEVQNYRPETVRVHDVVREAADFLQRVADAAEVRLELPPKGEMHWTADRGALFTLLKNLLENAIQHTPRGTVVRVELDATSLSVRDWGPGVPEGDLPSIFKRFWRGQHRRDVGAGLGLSISQEIALAHGWALRAQRADPGLRVAIVVGSASQRETQGL